MSFFAYSAPLATMTNRSNQLFPASKVILNQAVLFFIEPWIEPDAWLSGPAHMIAAEDGERKVCRVIRNQRDGDRSFLDAHYLFVNGTEVEYATERHELRLLSQQQWFGFFRNAGLPVEYLPEGLMSRGLYVARL